MGKRAGVVDQFIGQKIREAREARGLTLVQLGEKLDCSHQMVINYESGRTRIAASRLHEVASALRYPVRYFLPRV